MSIEHKQAILFVDDETHVLLSLRRLFRKTGYELFFAENGAQALKLIEQSRIDVIVSDMRMPEMLGNELLQKIKEKNSRIKQVILSGYSDLQSTISAINNADVFAYITKPWSDEGLLQTVEQALREKTLEEDSDILMHLLESKNKEFLSLNQNLEQLVDQRTKKLRLAVNKIKGFNETLEQSHKELVKLLVSIMGMKNGLSSKDAQFVADLAADIARKMGLTEAQTEQVYFAGLLHETGKLIIPDSLLCRAANTYSNSDYKTYREHASYAEMILSQIAFLQEPAQIIRHHEEHFDGSGFPEGLSGDQIPLESRILGVAKDYLNIIKGAVASYSKQEKEAYAFDIMHSRRAHLYDPEVLKVLAEVSTAGDTDLNDVALLTSQLIPGMVLSRDLYSSDEVMLLSKGRMLDEKIIVKLSSFRQVNNDNLKVHVFS